MMGKTIARLPYLFLAVGLILLGAAAYWVNKTQVFIERAVAAPGKVVDLERSWSRDSADRTRESVTYYPIVQFRTRSGEQRTFRSSSGSNPPGYSVGETVDVLYDASSPSDAKIQSFFSLWGGPLITGGVGAAFFLIGGGIAVGRRLFAQRAHDLLSHGMPVQTSFQGVEINPSISVNGRSPWRIVSQRQDPNTKQLHLFHSENLWFDPAAYIKSRELTVYVDRGNPKRYYMDVSFLPKLAE